MYVVGLFDIHADTKSLGNAQCGANEHNNTMVAWSLAAHSIKSMVRQLWQIGSTNSKQRRKNEVKFSNGTVAACRS
jgi:hypothetical protein